MTTFIVCFQRAVGQEGMVLEQKSKFMLVVWQKFFNVRMVNHLNRMPWKARLDGALTNLVH